MCDNCLDIWNPQQENVDGDSLGDLCDNDIDNDQILNNIDECPYHWGNSSCFNNYSIQQSENATVKFDKAPENFRNINMIESKENCSQNKSVPSLFYYLLFLSIILFRKKVNIV